MNPSVTLFAWDQPCSLQSCCYCSCFYCGGCLWRPLAVWVSCAFLCSPPTPCSTFSMFVLEQPMEEGIHPCSTGPSTILTCAFETCNKSLIACSMAEMCVSPCLVPQQLLIAQKSSPFQGPLRWAGGPHLRTLTRHHFKSFIPRFRICNQILK